jgi:multidrug resistance protein
MKITFAVAICSISYFLSIDIYTPSMPAIAAFFGSTSDKVQSTITFFLLGAIPSTFMAGYYGDKYGKRKVMMIGFIIALCGSALALFASSLNFLIFARFFQGFGGAMCMTLGFAIMQDHFTEKEVVKQYGILGICITMVPALAPFFGGLINEYLGWQMNFVVMLIAAALSLITIIFLIPQDETITKPMENMLKTYGVILCNKKFLTLALLSPLFVAVEWCMISYLPFYLQNGLHFSSDHYGIFIGATTVWYALGSYLVGKLHTISIKQFIYTALSLGLVGSLLLLLTASIFPQNWVFIYLSFSLFMVGFGILLPTSVTKALSLFREHRASASAIRSLLITSFGFIGTLNAEFMNEDNLMHLAVYAVIIMVMALWVYSRHPQDA